MREKLMRLEKALTSQRYLSIAAEAMHKLDHQHLIPTQCIKDKSAFI